MAAEDAVPNRLGAGVAAAEGLLTELGRVPGERAGVVAFSGRGELRCPLTENLDAALDSVRALRPGEIRPGGSDLGSGLLAALDAFGDEEPAEGRTIVVLTDGEDHVGSWKDAIPKLNEQRVVVLGVTIGDSEQGHTVPSGNPLEALRFRGETVLSRRSDAAIGAVCSATGGALVPIGQARADLGALYRDRIEPTTRNIRNTRPLSDRIDRSGWFVAAALGLFGSVSWPASRRVAGLAFLLAIGIGAGPSMRTVAQSVAAGEKAYRSGDFRGALAAFEAAILQKSDSAIPHFDAGAAAFQLGRYREAEAHYQDARRSADPLLRAKIDFALGNVAVARRQFKEALDHYDACLASPLGGPRILALKRDARANRSFTEKLIPPPSEPDAKGPRQIPDREQPKPAAGKDQPDEKPKDGGQGADGPAPPPGASTDSAKPPPSNPGGGSPPAGNAGTAEQQLDAMLGEVRKAVASGVAPPPPAGGPSTDRKDW